MRQYLWQLFENHRVLCKCYFPPVAPESLRTRQYLKLMFAFLLAKAWHMVGT